MYSALQDSREMFELEPDTSSVSGFRLEPVATWRVTFEGFDRRRIAVPFSGTRSAVTDWTGELLRAGVRDVRYVAPNGLEVQCRLRRPGTVPSGVPSPGVAYV